MGVRDLLVPDDYRPSIYGIDLKALRNRGIRGIILDLDNTLVQWNHPEPTEPLERWLGEVREAGFRACIVSNNAGGRVRSFAERLDVPGISKAVKPRRGSFRRAMSLMGTSPPETAVVGDQILTDVLGAKRLGLYVILVKPVTAREFVGTRIVRFLESLWLGHLHRSGRLPRPEGVPHPEGLPRPADKGKRDK